MSNKYFWISFIGIIISFVGGFLFANSLNRNEMSRLQAEAEQAKKQTAPTNSGSADQTLSDEEIRQKIAQADANPNDLQFQRDLGLALYQYGAMKQNADLISESTRLLQRAFKANSKDYDVIIGLGHAYFDMAAMKKDSEGYKQARDFYQKALEQKPDDSNIIADYGSTFLLAEPSDLNKASTELQKALRINPSNERALQFLAQLYLKQQNKDEAQKTLDKLRSVNPNNPMLSSLSAQVSQTSPN